MSPALDGFAADLLDRDASAVVADFDDDVAALLHRAQSEQAFGIFAGSATYLGWFNAVIQCVADGVRNRVFDGFEKALVELRLLALGLQADTAPERLAQVTHHARHFGEDI